MTGNSQRNFGDIIKQDCNYLFNQQHDQSYVQQEIQNELEKQSQNLSHLEKYQINQKTNNNQNIITNYQFQTLLKSQLCNKKHYSIDLKLSQDSQKYQLIQQYSYINSKNEQSSIKYEIKEIKKTEFQIFKNYYSNQQTNQINSKNQQSSIKYEIYENKNSKFLLNSTQNMIDINETHSNNLNNRIGIFYYQSINESSSMVVDEQNDKTIKIKQFKANEKQSKSQQIKNYENLSTKIQAKSTNLVYQDKNIKENDYQYYKIQTNPIVEIKRQLTNRNYQLKEYEEEIGGGFVIRATKQIGLNNQKKYLLLARLIETQNSYQENKEKLEFLQLLQETKKYIQIENSFELSLISYPQSFFFVIVLLEFQKTYIFLQNIKKIIDFFKENQYYLGKFIGEGGFGVVFDGKIYQNNKIQEVIFKIQFTDEQNMNESEEEYLIMKGFEKNINLINAIDYKKIDQNVSVILMEKCEYIKPSNILINRYGIYVITDFGTSTKNKNDQPIQVKGYTESFAPKEVIKNEEVNYQSDVYSLGKTLETVFKDYEKLQNINQKEKTMLQKFKQILTDSALREQVFERKTCLELHKAFYEAVIFEGYLDFLQSYIDKIRLILSQSCSDRNKDIYFFREVCIYYNEKILDLKQKIKKSHILNFVEIESLSQSSLRKIDKIQSQQDSEWNLYTARTFNKLAFFHKKEIGLEYSLKSLQMVENIIKGDNDFKSIYLNTLSWCYSSLNDHKQAFKVSEESLKMRLNLFKLYHPRISLALNNLGTIQFLYKENHPCIARSLHCVGQCYLNMGDLEQAKKLCCSFSSQYCNISLIVW
ncbi:kinase domain protein (macronuclear) [Tetrahymena thermophila SB210]|uniref:mitogen-activated protein kinase kinase n=1 Tax=Tetrahymena thermophila (strain SB210) TaxID=312017 RepID=Q23BT3_TETTS|nr:kinase domain protein [Tetrahymena thermophila SB210]EAR94035.3 kinase domain protein [Tetrahymena thermophila SB210]|eukprot:XP_001014280.3 kinase domain protein [Tetrahymena thermophila SB210]